jgi:RND family efflux transporter MFP subunit
MSISSDALTFALSLAAIAGLATAPGCGQKAPALAELPPPEVTIARPVVREVTDYFEFTGNTAAFEEVELRARVSGYLKSVKFTEGEQVKQGDLLYEIDPNDYQSALDRAEAEVARQDATVKKANADLTRTQQLFQKGVRTREELDQDLAAQAVAQAGMAAAQANVRQAKLDLSYTRIAAPISGRASRTKITPGNLIQRDATTLTTIVRTQPIYAYFTIDERTLLRYQELAREGGRSARAESIKEWKVPVEIGLANEEGFPRRGTLDFADNKVDPSTGAILVRAVLENQDGDLAPGLFLRVRLPVKESYQATLISERAVAYDQNEKYVLVVNRAAGQSQNVAEYRPVRLGAAHGGLRVVERGLKPDEWLIVNGVQRVRPGTKVVPREGPMPAASVPESPQPKAASKPAAPDHS